jgi:hypothetical protein
MALELSTTTWRADRGWSSTLAPGSATTLVLAFGGSCLRDDPSSVEELLAATDGSIVIGCSGAGEISGSELFDDGLSVARLSFGATRLELATAEINQTGESYQVGHTLAAQLAGRDPHGELAAIFVLSDGLIVNGGALVAGMVAASRPDVVITGGLAGDGDRFEQTWVIADGRLRSGVVTAVGCYGNKVRVGHGSRGGWDLFGPERRVTRADGNVLYEIDGQPALELYKKYLGERASGLPATALLFPLSVRLPGRIQRSVTRTILGVDEATQSLTFAGDIPQGALAQLMRANFDHLVDSAQDAADDAAVGSEGPTLAVAISCVGRRLLLGERTEDELDAAVAGLPVGAEMVGFYSYGEISPIAAGTCDLHNQTMTLTTFAEAA